MSSGYQVEFEKGAQQTLKKMDKHQSLLIMAWIQKNLVDCIDPRTCGKGLVVTRSAKWRYKIGDSRLIATINDETVTILLLEIGHRKNIYRYMHDIT
ncbi:type II toxin-antitoxin system RelE family toxin [Carnobacterium funditum]|uniref:type II toxin-antitoxin system RelE family toxin n=1 Tax=Carnobacterium funditum TaxID=2752 RepID=UPI00054EF4FA|nr:type II toxin-antitoxin system RelE/ParE family toxin [Carnobacterium funditum]